MDAFKGLLHVEQLGFLGVADADALDHEIEVGGLDHLTQEHSSVGAPTDLLYQLGNAGDLLLAGLLLGLRGLSFRV